jgi:hypothetical protein
MSMHNIMVVMSQCHGGRSALTYLNVNIDQLEFVMDIFKYFVSSKI